MRAIVESFLSVPMHFRVTILIGAVLLLWWIFGRLILKMVSLFPFLLGKFVLLLYKVLGLITGSLHKVFGRLFAWLDNGLTSIAEAVYIKITQFYEYLHKAKTARRGVAFVIALILAAYVLLPYYNNWDQEIFTFWKNPYITGERGVIQWMTNNGWLR